MIHNKLKTTGIQKQLGQLIFYF
ncbi:uncharacterized protein METZ01_LOCUS291132 [marine metagenome]|uniref:Uncharacterized protein n=1 Tax=marine metagenome TaxID=408172 RepID=A0A382LNH6_9ZZZZ